MFPEYGGRWKILHYYAKKFFSPVLVSPNKVSDKVLDVYIISDLLYDVPDVELEVSIYSWDSFDPISVVQSKHNLVRLTK